MCGGVGTGHLRSEVPEALVRASLQHYVRFGCFWNQHYVHFAVHHELFAQRITNELTFLSKIDTFLPATHGLIAQPYFRSGAGTARKWWGCWEIRIRTE